MPDTWSQVGISYPSPLTGRRAAFDAIIRAAYTRTVNVAVIGDSQETLFGGNGEGYISWLNMFAASHFGNLPSTLWVGPTSAGGGQPGGTFGSFSTNGGGSSIGTGGLTSAMFPPGYGGCYAYDSTHNGALYLLAHGNERAGRAYAANYSNCFNPADSIVLDVIAMRRNITGGQVRCLVSPQNSDSGAYFQPTVATLNSTDALLDSAGTPEARLLTFTGLSRNSLNYHQVYLKGTGASGTTTAIAGARFRNVTNPAGMVFHSFSQGGYRCDSWTASHAQAYTFLRACSIDIFMITLGVNDMIGAGQSPATYKTNLLALIAILRQANPSAKFVLRVEPYQSYTNGFGSNFDQLAGVHKEIVDADYSCILINTRRRMHILGQSATNEDATGLVDRGLWAASTAYSVGDVVNVSMDTNFPILYRCISAHTSAAAWATDGPGSPVSAAHSKWVRCRMLAKDRTDTSHHSAHGQMLLAQADFAGLISSGYARPQLAHLRRA